MGSSVRSAGIAVGRVAGAGVVAAMLWAGQAAAGSFVISTDYFSYTGTVTDPSGAVHTIPTATNGNDSTLANRRDGAIYMTPSAVPGSGPVSAFGSYLDYNVFMTAWYYTTTANTNGFPKDDPLGDRLYSGWGNPNNTNVGFVQLYDADASTRTAANGYWEPSLTVFHATVSGANAPYSSDYSRLWQAPGGSGGGGTFLTYAFELAATFVLPAVPDGNGWWYSDQHPLAVTGSFKGTFDPDSSSYPGIYFFDLTFDVTNWAFAQGNAALNGDFSPSFFAANAIPEPSTLLILAGGVFALGAVRRRSRFDRTRLFI